MGDCLRVQVRNGEWFANDGKTKRKSSQYFEVTHSPDLLLFIAVHSQWEGNLCKSFCAFPESGVPWLGKLLWFCAIACSLNSSKRADV